MYIVSLLLHLLLEKNSHTVDCNPLSVALALCAALSVLRSLRMCFFRLLFFNISYSICHSGLLEKNLQYANSVALCAVVLSANVFLQISSDCCSSS